MGKFLEHELEAYDFTVVRHAYLRAFQPDIAAALVFSRIVYWHDGKCQIHFDGRTWLAKSRFDWEDECCISADVAKRVIKKLADLGLITTTVRHFAGAQTTHISLNEDACEAFIAPHRERRTPVWGESPQTDSEEVSSGEDHPKRLGRITPDVWGESPQTITKTTTKTTAKSTERERETSQPVPAPGGAEPAMEVFRRGLEKDKRLLVRLSEKPEWGGVYDHGGVISALPEYFRHPNHLVKGYLDTQRSMFSVAGEEKIADEQAALKVGGQVAGMINQLRKEGYTCPQIAASMRAWFLWKPPDDWHSALVHHKPPAAWRRWIAEVWGPENPPEARANA